MKRSENGLVKRICESKIEGNGIRERPPVKWITGVGEQWREMLADEGLSVKKESAWRRKKIVIYF